MNFVIKVFTVSCTRALTRLAAPPLPFAHFSSSRWVNARLMSWLDSVELSSLRLRGGPLSKAAIALVGSEEAEHPRWTHRHAVASLSFAGVQTLLEYYATYNIIVLLIRLIQLVRSFVFCFACSTTSTSSSGEINFSTLTETLNLLSYFVVLRLSFN